MPKDSSLDIIDAMLANEDSGKQKKVPKKKRRGRPKGTTKKTTSAKATSAKKKPASSTKVPKVEVQYVTEDEWVELGRPQVWEGYTTNRLAQWKYKTKAYYEVLLELHRAAIQYVKLARTIDWYKSSDEQHLELCRKEIEAWRKSVGVSHHEMFNVVDIAYECEYKRKKLLKALRQIAIIVQENRKEEASDKDAKELTLNAVAQAPPNIRPNLRFVKIEQYDINDEIMGALADVTGHVALISEHACHEHPLNRGLRKPRNGCVNCMEYYLYNKGKGVKEKRVRG